MRGGGVFFGVGVGVVVAAAWLGGCAPRAQGSGATVASAAPRTLEPIVLPERCSGAEEEERARAAATTERVDVRDAAQRSLDFLTRETVAWQSKHQCMGCHVQGVTGEALSIGLSKQYTVDAGGLEAVFDGLLTVNGGVRTTTGYARPGDALRFSSWAFAGTSLARYDQLVSADLSDDLLSTALDLLEYQTEAGGVSHAYHQRPVATGELQGTYQAIMTWSQAYARSADDRWLTAISRAESFLQAKLDDDPDAALHRTQDVNYSLLGLLAAGVGSSEAHIVALQGRLIEAQNADGGWSYSLITDEASTPLATGQTLYTLRMLGLNDSDPVVRRGMRWLLERQNEDGGWSPSGAGKAEAMWAVLGLVATDVLSVNVAGIRNGIHVGDGIVIDAAAEDNDGAGVERVEVAIDDVVVARECGSTLSVALDASALETGPHTVDVIATNSAGKVALRRFMVYAGDVYMTQLGSKFSDGGTILSLRDIAPVAFEHAVELQIYAADPETGEATGTPLHDEAQTGAQGAMTFFWPGIDPAESPEFVARLGVRDADGALRQSQDIPFVHESARYQAQHYGQVSGRLHFEDNGSSANTLVELVDEDGRVVQSTRSTASGSYRFRNVKSGKGEKKRTYKVRVSKDGYEAEEFDFAPERGGEVQQDLLVY